MNIQKRVDIIVDKVGFHLICQDIQGLYTHLDLTWMRISVTDCRIDVVFCDCRIVMKFCDCRMDMVSVTADLVWFSVTAE